MIGKVLILLLLLLAIARPAVQLQNYMLVADHVSVVDFTKAVNVSEEDVIMVCFNERGTQVSNAQLKNQMTKVLIHGWLSSIAKSPWYTYLKDAYVSLPANINVIYVDYSRIAKLPFKVAAASTRKIGEIIAHRLMNTTIGMTNMHLLGYSLGAHVAGFVGRNVQKTAGAKLSRITLLDPTGILFERSPLRARKTDAAFVDAVHTDSVYGSRKLFGHVDEFVNGGYFQPGCPPRRIDDNCSHHRVVLYYVESVKKKPRVCKRADSWAVFLMDQIMSSDKAEVFGEFISHEVRGSYYLVTNFHPDFFD